MMIIIFNINEMNKYGSAVDVLSCIRRGHKNGVVLHHCARDQSSGVRVKTGSFYSDPKYLIVLPVRLRGGQIACPRIHTHDDFADDVYGLPFFCINSND